MLDKLYSFLCSRNRRSLSHIHDAAELYSQCSGRDFVGYRVFCYIKLTDEQ